MKECNALYLYCVADSRLREDIGACGVENAPLAVRKAGGLAAVVSPVPREPFCGEGAGERMLDLEWLGPRVCCHEAVIERVMRDSPVLPVPFGTLFSSQEKLDAFLVRNAFGISDFLRWVEDREEWAVKGRLNRDSALASLGAAPLGEGTAPGSRYLLERRQRREAEERLADWLEATCARVGGSLEEQAVSFRKRKVFGGDSGLVVNWAFLVARHDADGFRRLVKRTNGQLGGSGLTFECTGPWPPYSFTPAFGGEDGE